VNESILVEEGILSRADNGGALLGSKIFIARADELVKALLSLRWLERIGNYWEDYDKRSLSRKWQSFERTGQWF